MHQGDLQILHAHIVQRPERAPQHAVRVELIKIRAKPLCQSRCVPGLAAGTLQSHGGVEPFGEMNDVHCTWHVA